MCMEPDASPVQGLCVGGHLDRGAELVPGHAQQHLPEIIIIIIIIMIVSSIIKSIIIIRREGKRRETT